MNARKTKPRGYHHGNLESAILDAAAVAIETVGYENLSLRELASSVGVSRAAPYRHFASRLEFLEAIIVRGTKMLNDSLVVAAQRHTKNLNKVRAVFSQYLQFADEHPQLYRLCFASDTFVKTVPDNAFKQEIGKRFGFFSQYVALLVSGLDPKDVEIRAFACWSFLHGFAVLSTTERAIHVLGDSKRLQLARHLVIEQCLQLPSLSD